MLYFPLSETSPASEKTVQPTFDIVCNRLLKMTTILVDGHNVNRMMVTQGMAWAYRQYLVDRSMLDVEEAARSGRLGLWVDANPVPPWEWRAQKRNH